MHDAKLVRDFRYITLIDYKYKVIAKILANRIAKVIDYIVSPEQFTFSKGRQFLDGPMILNELHSWCKAHNHQTMVFKVDFQKAFDSIRWDFLDDLLSKFGFGSKWRS